MVQLFKKENKVSKNGEEKVYTNFYVKCGDTLIPIQIRFYGNDGVDPNFRARKLLLSTFAEVLPDKDEPKED